MSGGSDPFMVLLVVGYESAVERAGYGSKDIHFWRKRFYGPIFSTTFCPSLDGDGEILVCSRTYSCCTEKDGHATDSFISFFHFFSSVFSSVQRGVYMVEMFFQYVLVWFEGEAVLFSANTE